jgi:beta-glucanase (GH16 family)
LQLLVSAMAVAAAALALATGALSLADKPVSGPPASHEFKLVFNDDFAGDRLDPAKWIFAFYDPATETPTVAKRNLWGNAERQIYMDRAFLGLGIDPFTLKNGTLTIAAKPLQPADRAVIESEIARQPREIANSALKDVAYSSGMISSRGRFSQTYGYFEIRARWSGGKGIWPAFWLLPKRGIWPPEIDVMEAHGDKPGVTFQTLHSRLPTQATRTIRLPAADGQFHTYGMLWLADKISFYVDDKLTGDETTPADMHQPMYVLANLAIGGTWPGDPDESTRFPATMEIDYVRAWSITGTPTSAR